MTLRIAPTWLRFGSFEILHNDHDTVGMSVLLAYTVKNHFPHLLNEGESATKLFKRAKSERTSEIVFQMFEEIVIRTADMIGRWKANGFCHGVMNTDNMSILGITIDYGPFGFMDTFNPSYVSNGSDDKERYKFSTQENIGMWNLKKFGDTLSHYITIQQQVKALSSYFERLSETYFTLMAMKLGFPIDDFVQVDQTLIEALIEIMEEAKVDYHYFFRVLSLYITPSSQPSNALLDMLPDKTVPLFKSWWRLMDKRREISNIDAKVQRTAMLDKNPIYILRNHIAEKAIQDAMKGDYSTIKTLRRILANPTTKDKDLTPEEQKFFSSPPDENVEPVIVTCSS